MTVYVDTSVILRFALKEINQLKKLRDFKDIHTSELAEVECFRTIDRLRLQSTLVDVEVAMAREYCFHFFSSINIIQVDTHVLKKASNPLPTVVKTLDAIHLATAQLLRDQIKKNFYFATHDKKQANAAVSLGFEVFFKS